MLLQNKISPRVNPQWNSDLTNLHGFSVTLSV